MNSKEFLSKQQMIGINFFNTLFVVSLKANTILFLNYRIAEMYERFQTNSSDTPSIDKSNRHHTISTNALDTNQISSSHRKQNMDRDSSLGDNSNISKATQNETFSTKESSVMQNIGQNAHNPAEKDLNVSLCQNSAVGLQEVASETSGITNHDLTLNDLNEILIQNMQPNVSQFLPNANHELPFRRIIGDSEWQQLGEIVDDCPDIEEIELSNDESQTIVMVNRTTRLNAKKGMLST